MYRSFLSHFQSSKRLTYFFFYLAFVLLVAGGTYYFLRSEKNCLYIWDAANFWTIAVKAQQMLETEGFLAFAKSAANSFIYEDYSQLSILHLAMIGRLIGSISRLTLVLGIALPYFLLTAVVLDWGTKRFLRHLGERTALAQPWVPLSLVLLCFTAWNPTLNGYPDIGGVPICLACLFLYFSSEKVDWRTSIHIGLLLFVMGWFRRGYWMWASAFLAMVFIDRVEALIRTRRYSFQSILAELAPFFDIAINFGPPVCAAWVLRTLKLGLPAYSSSFAVYREGKPILEVLLNSLSLNFGIFYVGLFLAATLHFIRTPRLKKIGWLLLFQQLAILLEFSVLDFTVSHQHALLFIPAAFFVLAVALNYWLELALAKRTYWFPVGVMILTAALVVASRFVPLASQIFVQAPHFTPDAARYPCASSNWAEVGNLYQFLNKLPVKDGSCGFYLLGNGYNMNRTVIDNFPLETTGRLDPPLPSFCYSKTFDYEGKLTELFQAQYAIVTSPPATIFPKDQKIMMATARIFMAGQNISRAFSRLPRSFKLADGMEVFVFKKEREITQSEKFEFDQALAVSGIQPP